MNKPAALVLAMGILGGTVSAQKTITTVFGSSLPPYVFTNGSGMELEIIKRGLELKGYALKPLFVPFARRTITIADKAADAAATVNESSGLENVFYSDSHISYQNVCVTLASKGYTIESVADLEGKTVLAFQDASVYLGPEYAAFAKGNAKAVEIPDQESQVVMLFLGRTDVFVGDINIFLYYKRSTKKIDEARKKDEVVFPIFPPTRYKVAFADKAVRDDFNEGLRQLRLSGEYDAILAKYVGR
ncbi:MAG: transporter substrate-binding domain-containing protein [Spirochaetaceae bacterium]|nr:transporter substrate-binding domain-containing protein [Spirochaetaceae bacterium]